MNPTTPNAIDVCTTDGIGRILCEFHSLLNYIVPILIALGVVYFVWGVVQYVIGDGEEDKKKGRDRIIWGLIGFAVIISLWGLVNMVVTYFDLKSTAPTLVTLTGEQSNCTISDNAKLEEVLCYATRIINDSIIPLIFAVATVFFIWGAVKFLIINADEEAQREQGKQFMIWSIVAFTVMLSVWGLVAILGSTLGINETSVLPQVKP